MPLQQCTIDGVSGWKWGQSGKCYVGKRGRARALTQARAIQYLLSVLNYNPSQPRDSRGRWGSGGGGGGIGSIAVDKGIDTQIGEFVVEMAKSEVERISKEHPNLAKLLEENPVDFKVGNYDPEQPGTLGSYSVSRQEIRINPINMELSDNPVLGGSNSTVGGMQLAPLIRHELGHHVSMNMSNTDELKWGNTALRKGKEGMRELGSGISKYAQTNGSELFSESFTVYTGSNYKRGSLPKPIESYMDDVLGKPVTNVTTNTSKRKRSLNPLRADPSRTATLRRRFENDLSKRLNELKRKLLALIVEEDAFGLRERKHSVLSLTNKERSDEQRETREVISGVLPVMRRGDSLYGRMLGTLGNTQTEASSGSDKGANKERSGERRSQNLQSGRQDGRSDSQTRVTGKEDRQAIGNTRAGSVYESGMGYPDFKQPGSFGEHVVNQRWAFQATSEQVRLFQVWLEGQVQQGIITVAADAAEDAYWQRYVEEGYRKGAGRAFDDTRAPVKAAMDSASAEQLAWYEGTKAEFLKSSFGRPVHVDKVKLLAGRVLTDLKNVTQDMATRMSRELTDGLVQGMNPNDIARRMIKNGIEVSKTRARVIARTEIIRAHAEGQLDAMERLGVTKVGVQVEWSTAGDGRVCRLCQPMDGVVLKIKEARGLIPRHPNCRCAHIPANVGEPTKDQKRKKKSIEEAIEKSVSAERPKRKKRTIAEQRKRSKWAGADKTIVKKRPTPFVAPKKENA